MKRREFIAALGGAATFAFAARAGNPDRVRRVGVLQYRLQLGERRRLPSARGTDPSFSFHRVAYFVDQLLRGGALRGICVTNRINPAFYADVIMELFNEFRCYQTVSQRSRLLLHDSSSEEVEAISRHLPEHLRRVLPGQAGLMQRAALAQLQIASVGTPPVC
jgi:hypothetical protein